MDIPLYLAYNKLFEYLEATPNSKCISEGQAVLNANHIITCGVTDKTLQVINVFALCLQTSALTESPHEVKGSFRILTNQVEVQKFICSCKGGMSGQCKHVAAVLFLCTRDDIHKLPLLSSTDLTCYWTKNKAVDKYSPSPLLTQPCLASKVSAAPKVLSKEEKSKIETLFTSFVSSCSLAKHRLGRRTETAVNENCSDLFSPQLELTFEKVLQECRKENVLDQLPAPVFINNCCRDFYENLQNIDVANIAKTTLSNTEAWQLQQQFRITGSRCYSVYTYSLQDWHSKAFKYFWPKSFTSKYTNYGIEHEGPAREAYKTTTVYEIAQTGFIISEKQPWLGYSPDGIIFKEGKPIKLLEIKCPYVGKDCSADDFVNTCKYLQLENSCVTLKTKHMYYAQIQMGMSILNLPECDFVVYSSHSKNFLNIIVKYDENYAKALLTKLHFNYFTNMLHVACLNKNDMM